MEKKTNEGLETAYTVLSMLSLLTTLSLLTMFTQWHIYLYILLYGWDAHYGLSKPSIVNREWMDEIIPHRLLQQKWLYLYLQKYPISV